MIVTRRWLEEFIDLRDIDDKKLYEVFNSIGLEVDSIKKIEIPKGVVIGEIVSCQKHPEADKLSLCQINIGRELKQIICGAKNVVDARFVAVATEGTYLPEIDLTIAPVKLRGVESFGMVCSSSELGLPQMEDGIMILDESLGDLKNLVGSELREFDIFDDTIIEIELTANRGDCLSIQGVARDLSAYFDRPLRHIEHKPKKFLTQGIARILSIKSHSELERGRLIFNIIDVVEKIKAPFVVKFRVAIVDKYYNDALEVMLKYAIHSTGVILRAYDFDKLKDEDGKLHIDIKQTEDKILTVNSQKVFLSYVGIGADREFLADENSKKLLLEASYIAPDIVSKIIYKHKIKSDELYYLTSRGTNPNLENGYLELYRICDIESECRYGELPIKVDGRFPKRVVNVDIDKLNAIIGTTIQRKKINSILKRLGVETHGSNSQNVFGAVVPPWRHDIDNVQDIAEEIMRMVGIDNIPAKPLELIEANRITKSISTHREIKNLRQRAIAQGFFEAVTYVFTDREKLKKYKFEVIDFESDLVNPIVDELNTLRSTIVINLLDAVKRNISYGKRKISLFEVGAVFDSNRQESHRLTVVESGFSQDISILNQGKPKIIDFGEFTKKLSAIIGEFEIVSVTPKESLFHPFQYGKIYVDKKEIGYISKLHPKAQDDFGIGDTFVAEIELDEILPKHKNASKISNFQGVYKDLSLLIDRDTTYTEISSALQEYKEVDSLIKRFFIIDLYEDESFGSRRSLTIRFFLQSNEGTLNDVAIEQSMNGALEHLIKKCGVKLR
jgi:phenylalanyl-tRNA synthetase beta chain